MINAINPLSAERIELQSGPRRLSIDSNFAREFAGATRTESRAGSQPPATALVSARLDVPSGPAVAGSAGTRPAPAIDAPTPDPSRQASASDAAVAAPGVAAPKTSQTDLGTIPPGWSGPPNRAGSTYNPVAAWDQVAGQQPSWISGNYPGATWDSYDASGFLMPYSNMSPGPGEDLFSGANMNVSNQDWEKYYTETEGAQAAQQNVWGANNPNHLVPAPWLANNPDPQYTLINTADTSQPTQPNYVPPAVFAALTASPSTNS